MRLGLCTYIILKSSLLASSSQPEPGTDEKPLEPLLTMELVSSWGAAFALSFTHMHGIVISRYLDTFGRTVDKLAE